MFTLFKKYMKFYNTFLKNLVFSCTYIYPTCRFDLYLCYEGFSGVIVHLSFIC